MRLRILYSPKAPQEVERDSPFIPETGWCCYGSRMQKLKAREVFLQVSAPRVICCRPSVSTSLGPTGEAKQGQLVSFFDTLVCKNRLVVHTSYSTSSIVLPSHGNTRIFVQFHGIPAGISRFNIKPSSSKTPGIFQQAPRSSSPYPVDTLPWNFEERPV